MVAAAAAAAAVYIDMRFVSKVARLKDAKAVAVAVSRGWFACVQYGISTRKKSAAFEVECEVGFTSSRSRDWRVSGQKQSVSLG